MTHSHSPFSIQLRLMSSGRHSLVTNSKFCSPPYPQPNPSQTRKSAHFCIVTITTISYNYSFSSVYQLVWVSWEQSSEYSKTNGKLIKGFKHGRGSSRETKRIAAMRRNLERQLGQRQGGKEGIKRTMTEDVGMKQGSGKQSSKILNFTSPYQTLLFPVLLNCHNSSLYIESDIQNIIFLSWNLNWF